eukprot:CAMPEP_0183738822 /NCGR_PEP_ID=MMETSP0737-20130205/55557_1 /TAXON_ID=385413 /ORGANISM="Thalassiosira miniscula, Strain CCMP1093" /LENGTH=228 /DNA_ID=CAMNT_0025973457 /DNA_START=153 /DNA_END=839 /DNA_ORIENTATION=-
MESSSTLALTGLNVVIEDESDYVFVAGDLDDADLDDWDDVSYDHCDLSPSLSCATSVATNITLKDLNLIEDRDDGNEHGNVDHSEEGSLKRKSDSDYNSEGETRKSFSFMANPKNGRRISNKKLRKKVKMMKKAAAARAAAEALAAQKASLSSSSSSSDSAETLVAPPPSSSPPRTSSRCKSSPKRKARGMHTNNIAVACAEEALAAYREEIEAGKAHKKASPVNYVM